MKCGATIVLVLAVASVKIQDTTRRRPFRADVDLVTIDVSVLDKQRR